MRRSSGAKIACIALQKALAQNPEAAQKKIDGFTPEQRFFLGFAQIWSANQRDENTKRRVVIDAHSPDVSVATGPLSDLTEFQKAFNIPDGSPMGV